MSSFLALIAFWLLWKILLKHLWKKICDKKSVEDGSASVSAAHYCKSQEHCDNIYDKMSFDQLCIEVKSTKEEIQLLQETDTNNNAATFYDYREILNIKIEAVNYRIRQIALTNDVINKN